jgi:hypothetical protein
MASHSPSGCRRSGASVSPAFAAAAGKLKSVLREATPAMEHKRERFVMLLWTD